MAYLEKTQITDEKDLLVNPASEESTILLRRIAKILENQQAVDPQQRQRMTIDAITNGLTLSVVTTVNTVANLGAVNGWNQQMFTDPARQAYNTGIRQQLTFS
jgi:hypothetical protein